ncbi:helix-turn-helix transcriptional regulator [Bradyrhizobium manausense]|uniref:helix-turn-helix transcriptional regulator n=1 Tax=Bradyrhizobium manausense TaxID=989370 RepID=UPI001BAC1C57|nr:helix-turn-helix transcriptional regulator [Bradyrhizobium manausense]MBR0684401.1 helix-turn-helix transcriptional regulator [Bradyrhizobium manausense]
MVRSGFDSRFPKRNTLAAKALARNLRRLRKDKGWTQGELADELNIEQMAVSLIENSRANPTLETLEAIATCFGVKVIDLFETRAK